MERSRIRRWMLAVAIGVLGIVGFGSQLASASGGGGCGRMVTDAHGARIRIHSYCFTPTILRIRPGQTVTWINRDSFSHTVMGANAAWGSFGELLGGRRVTYRFVRAGVYPYVCTFHPGMVGAVIVGSGTGLGDARTTTTEAGPVKLVTPVHAVELAPQTPVRIPTSSKHAPTLAIVVAIGAMLAVVMMLVRVGRRRRLASS